jgi:NADH-quinone oxidoreductase subunit C
VTADELADRLRERFPDAVVARGQVMITVDGSRLPSVLEELRADSDLAFDFLSSVTATDWPGRSPRFWLAYELYSMTRRHRLRVKVGVSDDDPHVPSATSSFPTANWHEREVYDMFGVSFDGHPGLRRILMPEGWDGHPQRKTEELGGVDTQYKGAFIPPVDKRTT